MASQIILRNMIVKHNIPVTGYRGKTVHVIVFYNPENNNTWCWKTQTVDGLHYKPHNTYSIICTDEGNFNISHVREVDFDHDHPEEAKSEQPEDTKLNALDILLPDIHLTNDEKYDMIGLTRKGV